MVAGASQGRVPLPLWMSELFCCAGPGRSRWVSASAGAGVPAPVEYGRLYGSPDPRDDAGPDLETSPASPVRGRAGETGAGRRRRLVRRAHDDLRAVAARPAARAQGRGPGQRGAPRPRRGGDRRAHRRRRAYDARRGRSRGPPARRRDRRHRLRLHRPHRRGRAARRRAGGATRRDPPRAPGGPRQGRVDVAVARRDRRRRRGLRRRRPAVVHAVLRHRPPRAAAVRRARAAGQGGLRASAGRGLDRRERRRWPRRPSSSRDRC